MMEALPLTPNGKADRQALPAPNTFYAAFLSGKPSPLPEPVIQYADYGIWQREWLQGEALDKQVSYWRQQLLHGFNDIAAQLCRRIYVRTSSSKNKEPGLQRQWRWSMKASN